jgi:chemotaxis protein MotA
MDIATVVGVLSAFGLIAAAIAMGSGLELFISLPSLMVVVGGTLGATLVNYPLKEVLGVFRIVQNALLVKTAGAKELIPRFVALANKARREGILSLEAEMEGLEDEFFQKGLQLSIDGFEPEQIREIMETELDFVRNRHQLGAEVFTTMGTFAPAMGMIGTLIGLVQMLQSMDDPGTIGPAMAVALLTTFYGALLANIVCLPIAGKLRTRSKEETLAKEMTIQGVISLSKGENPRVLEQKLLAFLPVKQR